jgi:hypothetical protein
MMKLHPSLLLPCLLTGLLHAAPVLSGLRVADVTPTSLRVVWQSSESADPGLEIFTDPAGTIPATDVEIVAYREFGADPFPANLARDSGIMSVHVSGLDPDTTYYLRASSTSLADSSITTAPLQTALTAAGIRRALSGASPIPLANPVLRFQCLTRSGEQAATGSLLVTQVAGAHSPVTTLVGGNAETFVDLNNLFSATSRETMSIAGFEPVTLTLYHGFGETETFSFFTPVGDGSSTAMDPCLTSGPITAAVISPYRGPGGITRVFMEFPAQVGVPHIIQSGETLDSWIDLHTVAPLNPRLFWEDNALVGDHPAPATVPARFYRTRFVP